VLFWRFASGERNIKFLRLCRRNHSESTDSELNLRPPDCNRTLPKAICTTLKYHKLPIYLPSHPKGYSSYSWVKMAHPKIETPPGSAPTHDPKGYSCLMENISRNIPHNISRAQSEMSRTGNANLLHHEKGKPTSTKLSSESCPKVSATLPKAVWLISIVSLCERFSYYSLVGPLRESRSISQPYAKDCG